MGALDRSDREDTRCAAIRFLQTVDGEVTAFDGEISSLLTVKTLTGMTTDVYPRESCIAPAIALIVSYGPRTQRVDARARAEVAMRWAYHGQGRSL
jgi:hypothetical protein